MGKSYRARHAAPGTLTRVSRTAIAGAVAVGTAGAVILGGGVAQAVPGDAATVTYPTMTYNEQATGQGSQRTYNIYTENGGRYYEKLQLTKVGAAFIPAFKVLYEDAGGGYIYPNISQGAERGMRAPYTWYPVKAYKMGEVYTSTQDTLNHSGNYNADYDVWFEPTADTYGKYQSHGGTEIMIWLAAKRNGQYITRGPGTNFGTITLDGIAWHVNGSRTCLESNCWERIFFVAVHPRSSFTGRLNPFVSKTAQLHMLSLQEYLTGIDNGFEIINGGAGLAVTHFSVTGVK